MICAKNFARLSSIMVLQTLLIFAFVMVAYDDSNYFEIVKTYSGLFERLTRGNYLKAQALQNDIGK